jgi:hypothetical protein
MSGIKLPVRLAETVSGDTDSFLLDASNNYVIYEEIAAALNAAPKRAFAELTADGVGLILQNVLIEIGDPPDNGVERQEWLKLHDATVLAHLQAFAAPVAQGGDQ